MKYAWRNADLVRPEDEERVLLATVTKAGRQNIVIGYYADGRWCCGMNSNVTHWMPLPEFPVLDPFYTQKKGSVLNGQ